MPQLSVLVPAYNAQEFITNTLDSIVTQTFDDYELIISVDKSEDETVSICRSFAKKDPRIKLFAQKERLGWVSNTNFLLNQISAPYAVFAFHDDLLHQTYFSKLVDLLEKNPDACLSFSDCLRTHTNGETEHWVYSELELIADPVHRGIKILNRRGKWWVPNRGIFRSSVARQVGGLKKHDSGEFSADFPWLFHLSLYGSFIRIPETLCFKFYKAESLSRTWKFTPQEHYDVMASCMRELWVARVPMDIKLKLSKPLLEYLIRNG